MRKLLASIAVLTAILAPSLHLWCEETCGSAPAPTKPACHQQQPASDTALSSPHNCATHAQVPAVTVRSTSAPVPALFAEALGDPIGDALSRAGQALAVAPHPPDSPPIRSISQLRL